MMPTREEILEAAKMMEDWEQNPWEAKKLMDDPLDKNAWKESIKEVYQLIEKPDFEKAHAAMRRNRMNAALAKNLRKKAKDFHFPDRSNDIPIDPVETKFETIADAVGWLMHSGPQEAARRLNGPKHAPDRPFRWHDQYASGFEYAMQREPTGEHPVDIALFSDFGTGCYQSLYIARQFENRGSQYRPFDYAIHLGDVYYSGTEKEFRKHFTKPLSPIFNHTSLFTLNANHEMFSAAKPYFQAMDQRRHHNNLLQQQEGSYFALTSEKFRIIGIDTDYFDHHKYKHEQEKLKDWLKAQLQKGRSLNQANILLSSNQPYTYGSDKPDELWEEIKEFAKGIDLWFWGNTHYCALFQPNATFPFWGSCIGHGGYPYKRQQDDKPSPAPVQFLENESRFMGTDIRAERGNNGYCMLRLDARGDAYLLYVDWTRRKRFEIQLSKSPESGMTLRDVPEFYAGDTFWDWK